MRAGLAALWITGAGFIAIGCTAAAAVRVPPPMKTLSLTIGEAGRAGWTVEAAVPRWIPVGGSATVRLVVSPRAPGSSDAGLIVASLAAPTAVVSPPGDQVGPALDRLTFQWSVVPGAAGEFAATPSLSFRPISGPERLLWAEPIEVGGWTAVGLDAPGLTSAAITCGILGVGLILLWVWGRRKWNRRRTD